MTVGVVGWWGKGGAFVFSRRGETVVVNTGIWATAVWVGNGVTEGAIGETGALGCGNNDVLVGEGMAANVEVEPITIVAGNEVGVVKGGAGVLVRGCKRYDPVIAIAVLVLIALWTSASLAGPPEALQSKVIKLMNRTVTPNACK